MLVQGALALLKVIKNGQNCSHRNGQKVSKNAKIHIFCNTGAMDVFLGFLEMACIVNFHCDVEFW